MAMRSGLGEERRLSRVLRVFGQQVRCAVQTARRHCWSWDLDGGITINVLAPPDIQCRAHCGRSPVHVNDRRCLPLDVLVRRVHL